jgi:hypothetical protein
MGLIKFEDYNEESTNEAMKFTKSSSGMIPVGKKPPVEDVKIKKSDWDAMLVKINSMTPEKIEKVKKQLRILGLL